MAARELQVRELQADNIVIARRHITLQPANASTQKCSFGNQDLAVIGLEFQQLERLRVGPKRTGNRYPACMPSSLHPPAAQVVWNAVFPMRYSAAEPLFLADKPNLTYVIHENAAQLGCEAAAR